MNPLRYVYMDEAGTSANEPVTVVLGLIVDADRQLHQTETELDAALATVPAHLRPGFRVHAKEIWGSQKYRDGWSMQERVTFLLRVASIPRRLGLGLAFAMVRRNTGGVPEGLEAAFTPAEFHHFLAFKNAICRADWFMRSRARADEAATVVAEDVGKMKLWLKRALILARENPMHYPPELEAPTEADLASGLPPLAQVDYVERIRDTIFFADKSESPILQIADVCAFSLRRFFAGQSLGDDLARSVMGYDLNKPDFAGPLNSGLQQFSPSIGSALVSPS